MHACEEYRFRELFGKELYQDTEKSHEEAYPELIRNLRADEFRYRVGLDKNYSGSDINGTSSKTSGETEKTSSNNHHLSISEIEDEIPIKSEEYQQAVAKLDEIKIQTDKMERERNYKPKTVTEQKEREKSHTPPPKTYKEHPPCTG
ncbi:hypothetical protein JTB14_009838 [Gonioctena quinquepunctata]|nr:hypothetical protein JTB14_009838 [Gonioctena quinquepunctata]